MFIPPHKRLIEEKPEVVMKAMTFCMYCLLVFLAFFVLSMVGIAGMLFWSVLKYWM